MATVDELEAQVETLKRRCADLEMENAGLVRQHERDVLAQHIATSAHDAGIHSTAVPYVVERAVASGQWKLDSTGKLYRTTEDGTFDMDERGDYVSPLRWMKTSLRKDAPHLFVDAEAQAAAAGNTTPSLDGIKNPWLASHWNMSEQGRIYVRDPDLAQRLAADAGSAVGAAKPTR